MSAKAKIQTFCPACHARYTVPAANAGQKARCGKCNTRFRIEEPALPSTGGAADASGRHGPPTEEDILQWLNEGLEEFEFPARPRVVLNAPVATASGAAQSTPASAGPSSSQPVGGPPQPPKPRWSQSPNADPEPMHFRKTG